MIQSTCRLILVFWILQLYHICDVLAYDGIKVIAKDHDANEIQIRFEAPYTFNTAIFLRGNELWCVFDHPLGHVKIHSNEIKKMHHIDNNKHSINYFELTDAKKYEVTTKRENNVFIIYLKIYNSSITSSELTSKRNIRYIHNNDKNTIEVDLMSNKSSLISFIDPLTEQKMFVIPDMSTVKSMENSFVDFNLVESFSGIVIQSKNDDLKVNIQNKVVKITNTSYLNVIERITQNNSTSRLVQGDIILDLSAYSHDIQDFNNTLHNINSLINSTYNEDDKIKLYFELALFYLANQWYMEAKAVLEMLHRYFNLDQDYRVKTIIAIVYFMSNNIYEAYDMINSISLSNVDFKDRSEIQFWQDICTIYYKTQNIIYTDLTENLQLQYQHLIKRCTKYALDTKNNAFARYARHIANDLIFKILEKCLFLNKNDASSKILNKLFNVPLTNKELQYAYYFAGKVNIALNNPQKAITSLSMCLNTLDSYLYSHCKYEILQQLFTTSKIEFKEYVNNLQGLSTVWRGDKFEIMILNQLAQVYSQNNHTSDAIRIWQMIMHNYAGSYHAIIAAKLAGEEFIKYLKQSNDSKFSKLAFFYEFKDLMPMGSDGDQITSYVTSYMLDLNLVDQATSVMDYQIKHRLFGIAKENAINDLALTYYKINRSDLAIDLIQNSTYIPFNTVNPVINIRKYLYINALIELEQYQDAIAILYGDKSQKADELRAKIFFKLENWEDFNENSEPYLYSIRYTKKPRHLNNDDYIKILYQNIAYFNNNQMSLLNDLYEDMKKCFKKGSKGAEKNKLLYQVANIINDSPQITKNQQNIINQITKNILEG